MTSKKTDNGDLASKLLLRRHMLWKYHRGAPFRVFDCCQGDGVIWAILRREFDVANYWGVDVKKKRGRLSIDSSRIVCQEGFSADVIDIDTYGSPWKHYLALLESLKEPATVFLTCGEIVSGASREMLAASGAKFQRLKLPAMLAAFAASYGARSLLSRPTRSGLAPTEIVEAPRGARCRYLAVRLGPPQAR